MIVLGAVSQYVSKLCKGCRDAPPNDGSIISRHCCCIGCFGMVIMGPAKAIACSRFISVLTGLEQQHSHFGFDGTFQIAGHLR